MGCMNPLPDGRTECGICGYRTNGQNPPPALPVRTLLSDRYLVGKLLEIGGDAAVYLGYDEVLKAPIYIREFLPDTLCERNSDGSLTVIAGCEGSYREYADKFRSHARTLARMRELSAIVSVYDIFEQHNTVYTISEYCEGNTLETRLALAGGRIRWDEARPLFMPLLSALISLHSAGPVSYTHLHRIGNYPHLIHLKAERFQIQPSVLAVPSGDIRNGDRFGAGADNHFHGRAFRRHIFRGGFLTENFPLGTAAVFKACDLQLHPAVQGIVLQIVIAFAYHILHRELLLLHCQRSACGGFGGIDGRYR